MASSKDENTEGEDVYLYIYDLSGGLASILSTSIIGRRIEAIWHTSIIVYGKEYFFGSGGISVATPGSVIGEPLEKKYLGRTHIPFDIFNEYLDELRCTSFRGEKYNLFNHNCNNFSEFLSQFLVGQSIPSHILDLPSEVINSLPFVQWTI